MLSKYPLVTNGRLMLPGYVNEQLAAPEAFSGNVNYKGQFNSILLVKHKFLIQCIK